MEGGENHEPPMFCIEVNVPRGGQKLAVLQLHQSGKGGYLVSCTTECIHLKCVFRILPKTSESGEGRKQRHSYRMAPFVFLTISCLGVKHVMGVVF